MKKLYILFVTQGSRLCPIVLFFSILDTSKTTGKILMGFYQGFKYMFQFFLELRRLKKNNNRNIDENSPLMTHLYNEGGGG